MMVLQPLCDEENHHALIRSASLARSPALSEALSRRALHQAKDSAAARRTLARSLLLQGRFDEGAAVARECTELAPRDSAGWMLLANALAFRGLRGQAIAAVEAAVALHPQVQGLRAA